MSQEFARNVVDSTSTRSGFWHNYLVMYHWVKDQSEIVKLAECGVLPVTKGRLGLGVYVSSTLPPPREDVSMTP